MEKGDWFAIYKARDFVVFLLFWFSGDRSHFEAIIRIFDDAERFLFVGDQLIELVRYQWQKI